MTQLLQATLASVTSDSNQRVVAPHHPITCQDGKLYYEDDGELHCEHAHVSAGDLRTEQAVRHSIALLIIELAMSL